MNNEEFERLQDLTAGALVFTRQAGHMTASLQDCMTARLYNYCPGR